MGTIMESENLETSEIIKQVRKRATSTRAFAKISILGIVFVVGAMISFFTISGSTGFSYGISFGQIEVEKKASDLVASEQKTVVEAVKLLEEEIDKVRAEIEGQQDFQENVLLSVSLTIIRLASVFLAVYLIQILVGFTRYQFRMADHLDATADAFELTNGDMTVLASILSSIAPKHIEFGKLPSTPIEQTTDLIKELVNKIPGK